MNRLVAVVVALALWGGSAGAANVGWSPQPGPGGGGNWPSIDVSPSGPVALGSDVSGLYVKTGSTWVAHGYPKDANLVAANIHCVRWVPSLSKILLVGTTNSLYSSVDNGSNFTKEISGSLDFSAIACGTYRADSLAVYVFSNDGGTVKYRKGTRSAGGTAFSWGSLISTPIADSTKLCIHPVGGARYPIKAIMDPLSTDAVYLLLGQNAGNGEARELWRCTNLGAGTPTWSRLAPTGSTHLYPTDMCFSDAGGSRLLVSFDRETWLEGDCGSGTVQKEGSYLASIWKCDPATPTWTLLDSTNDVRGAITYKFPHWYIHNVVEDACGSPVPSNAGIWRAHRANDSTSVGIKRWNEGAAWDGFWGPCADARGQTIKNMANSVSADGQYWVGAMNVWKVNSSGELKRESTISRGGGGWSSNGIDNVNNAMLYVDGSDLYAGYYDIGLWKTSATSPGTYYDQNNNSDSDWGGNDNFGGNVNGMVVVGSTRYVIDAPSSKGNITDLSKEGYEYRLWKSVSGGSWTKLSNQPGWINNVDATHHRNHAYMRGICYDGTHLYVSSNGVVYRDSIGSVDYPWVACTTNLTDKDDPLSSPTNPIFALGAYNGVVLAGGRTGIFRSVNNGATWTRTCTLGSVACPGDTAGRGGNSVGKLHTEAWTGIHSFWMIPTGTDEWLATAYVDYDTSTCKTVGTVADSVCWGLLYSNDGGLSWTRLAAGAGSTTTDRLLRSVVTADTCDNIHRVLVTSGAAFSSGTSTKAALDAAHGADLLCLQGSTVLTKQNVGAGYSYYPPFSVGACAAVNSNFDFFITAPGFGPLLGYLDHPAEECGWTRAPGSASRTREEEQPPQIGRRVFSAIEAQGLISIGRLELYDVSGRRSSKPAPGLYFSVERNKAGVVTARHLVLVRR